MKGFDERDSRPSPNFTDVYRLFTEESVYSLYLNQPFRVGTFNSPIGAIDRHASFSIFYNYSKNKYIFKEHRYGYVGDCIDMVRYMFIYPDNRKACMRIMHDFGITDFKIDKDIAVLSSPGIGAHRNLKVSPPPREVDVQVTIRNWETYDILYWNQFGINKEWLERGNVWPISHYYINGFLRIADSYAYVYVENKDDKFTYKIYQPYADKRRKWLSNNDSSVWELWELMPDKYPLLIITKSRKDALSIMSTLGVPSVSLQSESTLPKQHIVDELNSRFDKIYLLYDNDFEKEDNYGMKFSNKMVESYGFKQLIIPEKYGEKDYSDLVKRHGVKKSKEIITSMMKDEV